MVEMDLRTLRCPEPLLRVKLWLRDAQSERELLLWLGDPGSRRDIPHYLTRLGHRCVTREACASHLLLWVQLCHKESL